MVKNRLRSWAGAAVAVVAVLAVSQGPASAASFVRPFEDDIAASAFDGGGERCYSVYAGPVGLVAKGCFTRHGDVWRIQDSRADSNQTFIYWENWLNDVGVLRPYRHGECNNDLGSPYWGTCNKDYYENGSTNYFGDQGSLIRFQVCTRSFLGNNCFPEDISQAAWITNNQ